MTDRVGPSIQVDQIMLVLLVEKSMWFYVLLAVKSNFTGACETFLFLTLTPQHFSGIFGLWLDEDLLSGTTQPCETFDNPVLSYESHFKVFGMELWAFDNGA